MFVELRIRDACAQPAAAGCFRKAAGGGMCVRYRGDRANPIAIAAITARNGLLVLLAAMIWVCPDYALRMC